MLHRQTVCRFGIMEPFGILGTKRNNRQRFNVPISVILMKSNGSATETLSSYNLDSSK